MTLVYRHRGSAAIGMAHDVVAPGDAGYLEPGFL